MLPIVNLVRREVRATGLSLRVLAAERNTSYGTLQRYHNVNLKPLKTSARQDTVDELARALNVTPEEVNAAMLASMERTHNSGDIEQIAKSIPVEDVIMNDVSLSDEAKKHLVDTYHFLRRHGAALSPDDQSDAAAALRQLDAELAEEGNVVAHRRSRSSKAPRRS